MLFEPGSRTVPGAPRSAPRSRWPSLLVIRRIRASARARRAPPANSCSSAARVAALEQRAHRASFVAISGRARPASASRLARQMSRHISGWLQAMRVKSRKPPAAKPNSCAAFGARRELVHQRIGEQVRQMAHRGEHAVVLLRRSCGTRVRRSTSQACSTAAHARGAFSGSGVSTTRRSRNRSALRRRAPLFSAPAIGCAGTNCAILSRQARARRRHHVLLGAAGVGDQGSPAERGAMRRITARHLRRPASPAAPGRRRARAAGRRRLRSMTPRSSAAARLRGSRPTPTTRPHSAGCLQRQRERAADQADTE